MVKKPVRTLSAVALVTPLGSLRAQEGDERDASTALKTSTAIAAVLFLALILVVLFRILLRPR